MPAYRKIFPHVRTDQLPKEWIREFHTRQGERFNVVVMSEIPEPNTPKPKARWADQAFFGMWKDREDIADVEGYIRNLRKPRHL